MTTVEIAFSDQNNRPQLAHSIQQALSIRQLGSKLDESAIKRSIDQLNTFCVQKSRFIYNKAKHVETKNQRQAEAQGILNNLIIRYLINSSLKYSRTDDNASAMIKSLEEQYHGRENAVRIRDVAKALEYTMKAGLVQPSFPAQGDGHIDTPILLVKTALDSFARRIDSSRTSARRQTATGIVKDIEQGMKVFF